jgi:hypothetical protein
VSWGALRPAGFGFVAINTVLCGRAATFVFQVAGDDQKIVGEHGCPDQHFESVATPQETALHGKPRTCANFAGFSRDCRRIADCLAERGGFEPPSPFRLWAAENSASSAHYFAKLRELSASLR